METELLRGIQQFNRREFYECHETLEALWLAEKSEVRQLYQGVLQVGVAFHHLLRGNYVGAVRLLDRGLNRLRAFGPACRGVDVAGLMEAASRCREQLVALGPNRIGEFDRSLIPVLRLAEDKPPPYDGVLGSPSDCGDESGPRGGGRST